MKAKPMILISALFLVTFGYSQQDSDPLITVLNPNVANRMAERLPLAPRLPTPSSAMSKALRWKRFAALRSCSKRTGLGSSARYIRKQMTASSGNSSVVSATLSVPWTQITFSPCHEQQAGEARMCQ